MTSGIPRLLVMGPAVLLAGLANARADAPIWQASGASISLGRESAFLLADFSPARCRLIVSPTVIADLTRSNPPQPPKPNDMPRGSAGGVAATWALVAASFPEGSVQVHLDGHTLGGVADWRQLTEGLTFIQSDDIGLADSASLRKFIFPWCDPGRAPSGAWADLLRTRTRDQRRVFSAVAFEWIVWGSPHASVTYLEATGAAYDDARTCWKSGECDDLIEALTAASEVGP